MAVFHSELSRDGPGLLLRDILKGDDPQIEASRRIILHANADILILAGVDYDLHKVTLEAFADPLEIYPHLFMNRPNRGIQSGRDLNGDGRPGGPDDAFGYAEFAGQDGLAILSKFPLKSEKIQDFSVLQWIDLPDHIALNANMATRPLSTTGHWIVPVELPDGTVIDILTWHATPPVFDDANDANGRRNHDETAFWLRALDGEIDASVGQTFVIAGIANLDPIDGDGRAGALNALLSHPKVTDPKPASAEAPRAANRDGGVNAFHLGDSSLDTVDWPDTPNRPGNMRVAYILPSRSLFIVDSGVLWPDPETSLGRDAMSASRHRLVWVDICLDRACNRD